MSLLVASLYFGLRGARRGRNQLAVLAFPHGVVMSMTLIAPNFAFKHFESFDKYLSAVL